MSRIIRESNLERLSSELEQYCIKNSLSSTMPVQQRAAKISGAIFLANSSASHNFLQICDDGFLASKEWLCTGKGVPIGPTCAEVALGTTGDIFFYLAPFRFPATACGLLFSPTLESERRDEGFSTPFDSGSLHHHCTRPDPSEPLQDFRSRHDLPLPEHRQYLEAAMHLLFERPEHYVDGIDPVVSGPIGLTGGDCRRWTHEVRLPGRVHIRTRHLQAVWASKRLAGTNRSVENLFTWCRTERVDCAWFEHPSGYEFERLRELCLDYIRSRVY